MVASVQTAVADKDVALNAAVAKSKARLKKIIC